MHSLRISVEILLVTQSEPERDEGSLLPQLPDRREIVLSPGLPLNDKIETYDCPEHITQRKTARAKNRPDRLYCESSNRWILD